MRPEDYDAVDKLEILEKILQKVAIQGFHHPDWDDTSKDLARYLLGIRKDELENAS